MCIPLTHACALHVYTQVLDNVGGLPARPRQIEFSRLNLQYCVVSKRKLLQLVREKHVEGCVVACAASPGCMLMNAAAARAREARRRVGRPAHACIV